MPRPAALVGVIVASIASWFTLAPAQSAEWKILTPTELTSEGGASFEVDEEGVIFVAGPNADRDVYTITADTDLTGITAFRVEVFPDRRLPSEGCGRAHNGNFVLSRFLAFAGPPRSKNPRPVELVAASANFSQDSQHVSGMIDGGTSTGWSVYPKMRERHEAVAATKGPIDFPKGTRLRFKFDFQFGSQHTFGKFRLAATTTNPPPRAEGAPAVDPWNAVQKKIDQAIDRGVDFLVDQQGRDGSWHDHQGGYRTGMTALALYTLLKSGVRHEHPAVLRATAFLRTHESVKTYELAVHLMALDALGDRADDDRIEEMGRTMISWQTSTGGYAYPDGAVDLSNMQYAALGLRVVAARGAKIPAKIWERLAEETIEHQERVKNPYGPAGFSYRKNEPKVTGSMTAAGVSILAICNAHHSRVLSKTKQPLQQGVTWLGQNFSPRQNPTATGPIDYYRFYYLYGIERVGGLLDVDKLGTHDWYREGARFLVDDQKDNGSWWDKQDETCFALLFLRRATAAKTGAESKGHEKSYGTDDPAVDVSLRAAGDSPLSIWVSSFGDKVAETLVRDGDSAPRVVDVVYYARNETDGGELFEIGKSKGNPSRGSDIDRYPAQVSLPANGEYVLHAEVTVEDPNPPKKGGAATIVLKSVELKVKIRETLDRELLAYASDASRNEVAQVRVQATASSEIGGHEALLAVDNLQSRGWCSDDNDPKPSLTLNFDRAIRGDVIVLSQHSTRDGARTALVKRARLVLNGRHEFDVDMDLDLNRKTVFVLKNAIKIDRVQLNVLEVVPSTGNRNGVGFAEVEIRDSKRRGR